MNSRSPDISILLKKASEAWIVAGERLGIRVTAPFMLASGCESIECVSFLPDFGSWKGTIVGAIYPPDYETDKKVADYAKRNGIFCSFPSLLGHSSYDEAVFKDALEDWGYFGPLEDCPDWYGGYNHTQVGITHRELVRAWTRASRSLGIQVMTDHPPFTGRCTFIALLPDFGSPAGMVLGATYPPGFDKDQSIEDFAKGEGMLCSFLDGPEYAVCDEEKLKKVLLDWGYFGPPEKRPGWLTG